MSRNPARSARSDWFWMTVIAVCVGAATVLLGLTMP